MTTQTIESVRPGVNNQATWYNLGSTYYSVLEDDGWPSDGLLHVVHGGMVTYQELQGSDGIFRRRAASSPSEWGPWS